MIKTFNLLQHIEPRNFMLSAWRQLIIIKINIVYFFVLDEHAQRAAVLVGFHQLLQWVTMRMMVNIWFDDFDALDHQVKYPIMIADDKSVVIKYVSYKFIVQSIFSKPFWNSNKIVKESIRMYIVSIYHFNVQENT